MEQFLLDLLREYGYAILFVWSMLEGELGLITAGIMSHTGDMNVPAAIAVSGVGAFIGDQVYFYIGRFNKGYIQRKMYKQRRKFAIAHVLLKKYGWPIIFAQRYLYGMRTVIPLSIGITKYSAQKFAIINFISAVAWASFTIIPSYYFGAELLELFHTAKKYWYYALPIAGIFLTSIYLYLQRIENKFLERKHERSLKQRNAQ